jgi:hypothetical protein
MNSHFAKNFISKKLNFVIALFLLVTTFFANAQNPTVINDSLVVNNRVYAKEKLIVDQEAKFKEDIKVLGTARLIGDLIVSGTAKFNGNVKMEGIGSTVLDDSLIQVLVILPNGQVKKTSLHGLTEYGENELISCPPGDVPNPHWQSGFNKLTSPCPPVYVGIGTNTPLHKLHVIGVNYASNFLAGNVNATTAALINAYSMNSTQTLINLGVKIGSGAEEVRFTITNKGEIKATNVGAGPTFTMNNGTGHAIVVNANNGSKILQLENSGMLRAREIKVDEASWPDYVFDKDYKLPKLKDVAKYIDDNHHLPGVPSAAEIESDGLNLGDMQNIQMQKIEELTLYLIEMEKRIEALEKENEELKNSIK